ncbi:type II toxin-antitoxin system HicB family antitoxin [Paenibacillus gansuensis]|uniref:Type II toxin-antitoxin system HicB family antitoxin n=1 Tax=Paenibacillus gansuensis TaxID=306542 RepID=A0ABW5PJJ5_9BACL
MNESLNIEHYMRLSYNIITEFVADSPFTSEPYYFGLIEELPDCHAFGNDMPSLLKELQRIKEQMIESRLANGEFIPEPGDLSLRRPSRVRVMLYGEISE